MANIFSGLKTVNDYRRAEEEFQLNKQLKQAQAEKAKQEATELDVKGLGEAAFLKIGQGLPLTPQETAAAKFLDAKSGGMQFDPSTGAVVRKPSLFDKMPLNDGMTPEQTAPIIPAQAPAAPVLGGGLPLPTQDKQPDTSNAGAYEKEYLRQLAEASGNPKLQQTVKSAWAKSTMEPTEAELKAAGFADRMKTSNVTVGLPAQQKAALQFTERMKAAVPFIGNKIVSGDYGSFNQAQRDFINAQLRRESGAVISPSEFENAEKQYFPVPGDDEQRLKQKRINRETAVNSMISSSGAAYEIKNKKAPKSQAEIAAEVPPELQAEANAIENIPVGGNINVTPKVSPLAASKKREEAGFALRKKGFTPEQVNEYLKAKGL